MAKADGGWSTTLRKRKVIALHFLGLRTILFVAAQVLMLSSSDCKIDNPRAAANSDIVMSFTYFQYEQRGEANFKSLIIITKSIGPNSVPRGTPARTGSQLETVCPSLTHCHRSVTKAQYVTCYSEERFFFLFDIHLEQYGCDPFAENLS